MKTNTIVNDFTEGPLFWKLLRFALPFMLSNAMQVLYSLVDMAVVGKYVGSPGLAAVSLASQCFVFMTMMCLGFCTGAQVYVSQLIGSGDRGKLNHAIGTLFTVILGLGAVMTFAGLAFSRPFLNLLNTPEASYKGALDYMIVCSSGIIFSYGYNMVSAVLRGMGDSRHPFVFIVIASVINIVLDLLFVAGFNWGVFGAGLATIIGQAFSFLYALWFLYRKREDFGFDFKASSFRIDTGILRGLLRIGVPFAIRFCAINMSMLFVMALVGKLGHNELATYGTGIKLDDTVNKIAQGVMMALSGVVGQNYGARNFARIKRAVFYTWAVSIGMYLFYTILLLWKTETLFGFFSDDPEVLRLSHLFVSGIVWHFPALLIMKGTNGFIHGIGNAWLGLIFAFLDGFVLRIAFTWLLGIYFGMGFWGFIFGYGLASYGMAIPGLFYFLFCPWEKRKLVTE